MTEQPEDRSPVERRLPTMRDVAEHAGVSRQLVSMIMRGVPGPSEASRERVLASARVLGFAANTSARLLRQARTRLLGVGFAAHNPFEATFVERLLERAADQGFGVVLAPMTERRTTEVVVTELLGHRVEALACFNPTPDSPALERALDMLPTVWLGERSADPRADVVRTDDDRGLELAVDHLVALGHRAITYVGGRGGVVGPDRAECYRAAMRRAGLADRIEVLDASFDEDEAADAARSLLTRDPSAMPTAVIGCSDQAAVAVRSVLVAAGVAVPGQVSVIGYDDSEIAGLSFNDLTSVRQDIDLTVEATLEAIRRRSAAAPGEVVPPRDTPTLATLTVRGSTGPARS